MVTVRRAKFVKVASACLLALGFWAGCQRPMGVDPPTSDPNPGAIVDGGLQGSRPPKDRAWVIIGSDTVVAEVADSQEEWEKGLMHREEVPPGTGMLFVWEEAEVRSFWMKNTLVSLDVAFIDPSFTIIDIQQMEAESTEVHTSDGAALYALEVVKGWFAEKEIRVGDEVAIEFGEM